MSELHREHPEEAAAIYALPPGEQHAAELAFHERHLGPRHYRCADCRARWTPKPGSTGVAVSCPDCGGDLDAD